MTHLAVLNTQIRILDNLYSLNDLHVASGAKSKNKPTNFVRLEQTQELIQEIDQGSDMRLALEVKHGGHNRGTWVCKELVYAYAMWISAKFHLQVIRAFDAMMQTSHTALALNEPRISLPANPARRHLRFCDMHDCGWHLQLNQLLSAIRYSKMRNVPLHVADISGAEQELHSLLAIIEAQAQRLHQIEQIAKR